MSGSWTITPPPGAEEVAAIVAALHQHRQRQLAAPPPAVSAWQRAARQQALRPAWPARQAQGWRGGPGRRA